MKTSRFSRKSSEHLLFTAAGMVIIVILTVFFWVIPHVIRDITPGAMPDKAVPAFWVLFALHVIILAALINLIRISRRGRRLRKTGLIISGIILILVSMLMLEAASLYLEEKHVILSIAIVLFIDAFCDLIAGIITVLLPIRLPESGQEDLSEIT